MALWILFVALIYVLSWTWLFTRVGERSTATADCSIRRGERELLSKSK
jgi:hypothetical protein